MPKDRETELKYLVPSETVLERLMKDARALNFPGLAADRFSGPFGRNDTYYDTENLTLLRAGRCFRMGGVSAGFARISFKEKTDDPETRIEIEAEVEYKDIPKALQGKIRPRPVAALRKIIGKREIRPKLRVYKLLYGLTVNTCKVTFGHVVYAGPSGSCELLDLEIEERLTSLPETSKQVAAILAPRYGLALDMRSKYEMGMALVGGV